MQTLEERMEYARRVAQAARQAERVGTADDRAVLRSAVSRYTRTKQQDDLVALGDVALTIIERSKP